MSKTKHITDTLRWYRATFGPVIKCGLPAFRAEMINTFGCDAGTFDAAVRVGTLVPVACGYWIESTVSP